LRSRSGRLAENLLKSNACRQRLRLPRDHMPSFMEGQSGSPGRARERPR
jgi:hypothetical protein